MPLESPVLDDLRYQTVAEQLRRQIPLVAPEWTDHNDSDPGITLLQLFAHLAEQVGYRLNRLPDKAYVEFLKLVGIRLRPAEAARTSLAFYLGKPETAQGFAVPEASRVRARVKQGAPPTFETLTAFDVVPAQLVALASTWSGDLRDISAGTPPIADDESAAAYVPDRFSLAWDGRTPKLKDWPEKPVSVFARPSEAHHSNLWLALAFNPSVTAGFIAQRVTLLVELDDDEQPDPEALATCGASSLELRAGDSGPRVAYSWYRPAQPGQAHGTWVPLALLADTTAGFTRSGFVRFDVPAAMGPIPDDEWRDVRSPAPLTTTEICANASGLPQVLPTPVPHPLVGALKTPVLGTPTKVPVSGWIRVQFLDAAARFALRAVTFNSAPAIAATTVVNEFVGKGNGRSDQSVPLANRNVLSDTLDLLVEDVVDGRLYPWTARDDFDLAGPDDRVYVLDPEAGTLYFGDGIHGRVPGLGARVVAARYRYGGGVSGELAAGTVTQADGLPSGVQDVTNVVAARGGRDAETLDDAKRRAPRALKTLGRAVTADDFDLLARQATGVRIARTALIPLRRPYQAEGIARAGVDLDRVAPGALSLIAVPEGTAPFLLPTEGALRTLCSYLDRYRLITTELYVVAPQYVRLFDIAVTVVPAVGFGRTQVRDAIAARLERYVHVLTGGPLGTGTGFGGTLSHSELLAELFRCEGVARVESFSLRYDGNVPADAGSSPGMSFRAERLEARKLVGCPTGPLDDDRIELFADESAFVDTTTLEVVVQP